MSFNVNRFIRNYRDGKTNLKSNCYQESDGSVVYHKTTIVKKTTRGGYEISTGGWMTPATKSHINATLQALGFENRLYQRNFEWFWSDGSPFREGDELFHAH